MVFTAVSDFMSCCKHPCHLKHVEKCVENTNIIYIYIKCVENILIVYCHGQCHFSRNEIVFKTLWLTVRDWFPS